MKNAHRPPLGQPKKPETPIDPADLALRALAFLAAGEDRVARFLSLTGLDPGEIRRSVSDPGFHLAVLDHLAGDERLLLAFADAERLSPEAVGLARRALGGGD